MSLRKLLDCNFSVWHLRKISTKPMIELQPKILQEVEEKQLNPRKHPGIVKAATNAVPIDLVNAMRNTLFDFPIKSIGKDSLTLVKFLAHRHAPLEKNEMTQKTKEVEKYILNEHTSGEITDESRKQVLDKYHGKINKILKTKIHAWSAINYNAYTSLQYLVGRSAPEYAVLVRIFSELNQLCPDFKPRGFFDFGSGVGTGVWAAKLFWEACLFEYFCVDTSPDMNDLAELMLQNGFPNKKTSLKGVFRRQFLPATNVQYDIVLSAYSLLELPSSESRLETILNLWNKTLHFLIIVEQGNNAGFKVTNEARDFILNLDQSKNSHVFMPCPHDNACPRFAENHTPCNFEVNYLSLPFESGHQYLKERYSYVVIRKGSRDSNNNSNWPRIVRPTLVRRKHTICRMCTAEGKLEEVIFSATKHGKSLYRCARSSKWGDCLPVSKKSCEQ